MEPVKDRHPDALEEANSNRQINTAKENDADFATESFENNEDNVTDNNDKKTSEVDNGFFTDDDDNASAEIKSQEHDYVSDEKIIPVSPDAAQTINENASA